MRCSRSEAGYPKNPVEKRVGPMFVIGLFVLGPLFMLSPACALAGSVEERP